MTRTENGATYCTDLREANMRRQALWNHAGTQPLDLTYRTNELAGEAGEACNVAKKLERESRGLVGSRETVRHLAEELADVAICVDLVALSEGLPPVKSFAPGHEVAASMADKRFDRTYRGAQLARFVGKVCGVATRVEGRRRTNPGTDGRVGERDRMERNLRKVLTSAFWMAACEGIDLQLMIIAKFNTTSLNVQLPVYMERAPEVLPQVHSGASYD